MHGILACFANDPAPSGNTADLKRREGSLAGSRWAIVRGRPCSHLCLCQFSGPVSSSPALFVPVARGHCGSRQGTCWVNGPREVVRSHRLGHVESHIIVHRTRRSTTRRRQVLQLYAGMNPKGLSSRTFSYTWPHEPLLVIWITPLGLSHGGLPFFLETVLD